MRKIVAPALLLALAMPLVTLAQNSEYSGHPPKVLLVMREDVKPGKGIAHEKNEAAWTQAIARAKYPTYFLAMTAMTGPSQAWFCFGYDSFAALEKDNQAQDKSAAMTAALNTYSPRESELLEGGRQMVAVLNEDVSYKPNFNLPEMRYFRVRTVRVKYGHDAEYLALRKLLNAAFERAEMNTHVVTFHVTSGAPAGTYLNFYPSKSASEWDQPGPNLEQLLGSDYSQFLSLADKSMVGYEDNIFQFNNKMSYPSPQMIAADKWWAPKPAAAPAPAAAAEGAKKEAPAK